ncbi:MAG: adenosine monophosphate-protein transferase [Methanobacteriota archaeon]|nr:MAG: adenosine monophosphate-protein transferase [Euryarchaeota archaeon]
MEVRSVPVDNPDHLNVIIGQTHFIKTAEDLHEAIVNSVPAAKFGVAFCEASGPCLVRVEGNDPGLRDLAARNALAIGAGHTFVVFLKDAYPVNVLRAIRDTPEVVSIFCATANPVDVLVVESPRGRGVVGVIDGERPKGLETEADRKARREFLRKIGYKLG